MNYLTTHKKQVIALLVILPLLALGVYLALNQTLLKSRASQGNITFAPESVTKKPGEDVVITLNVNPNGASAVGVSTVVNFNADLLTITPTDITAGTFGEITEKTVAVNGNQGTINISAVNFNKQALNFNANTASTTFASLNFKAKNTTGAAALSLGDILVVAPGSNQTISVDKGGNANITISGQGLPRVAAGPSPVNSEGSFAKVCAAKGLGANCVLDSIAHIDGWDTPSQNEEFVTLNGDWWVFGSSVNSTRSEQTGKLSAVFPDVCPVSDPNCKLTSVAQFKGYDSASQNEVMFIKDGRYWIYQPVDSNDQRPAPTSGSVNDIAGVPQACQGLTNCTLDTVSQYRGFDTAGQNDAFIVVHGQENGQQVSRFAIAKGLYQNGQVQSSRGQIVTGDLMQNNDIKQLCSNNPNCIVTAAVQYTGWDTPDQNQDLIIANVNGEGKFIVRNGLNSITTSRPTPPPVSGGPTVPAAVACNLTMNATSGGLNDSFVFTLNSPALAGAGIPSGSELIWQGTNNGQAVSASSAGISTSSPQVIGTFKGSDFGGAGTYTRYIQVKKNGTQICQTVPVTVTVQAQGSGPTVPAAVACSLSVNRSTGRPTDDFTFTLNSPALAGAGIPSGSQLLWGGTNNGSAIAASSAGTSTSSPQVIGTFKGSDFGSGNFGRYIQVMRNGTQICQTVPVAITVSSAVPSSSGISANIVNSTGTQANSPATGSIGTNFPAGQFVASAFVPNASSDSITGTGMYVVKVDPQTMLPVANPTWNCTVSGIANPIVNVTDTNSPANFRTRYCIIADGVSGQKQFLNNITSKAFSVTEPGTYIAFIDANAGPTALSCTGAPSQWGSLPGKTACSSNGSGFVTLTVGATGGTSPTTVKNTIEQIIADYGLSGASLNGDYNKDGKINSLDLAFQLFKSK